MVTVHRRAVGGAGGVPVWPPAFVGPIRTPDPGVPDDVPDVRGHRTWPARSRPRRRRADGPPNPANPREEALQDLECQPHLNIQAGRLAAGAWLQPSRR